VFQAMLSERPVFALLHRDSTAVGMIRSAHVGEVLTLTEVELPTPDIVARALKRFIGRPADEATAVDRSVFEGYSARESTRLFAEALDRACARRMRP